MVDVLDFLWIVGFIENLSKVSKTSSLNSTGMAPSSAGRVVRR